ncbi:hypothetical protein [Georgenia muralis]
MARHADVARPDPHSADTGRGALAQVEQVAMMLRERNALEAELAEVVGRPPLTGHLGEWIASQVFDIELERSASNRGWDGRFRSPATLAGKTVDVKFYLKREGLLDMVERNGPDYYLVLAGPRSTALSSRLGVRPTLVQSVHLFDARQLVEHQKSRGAAVGTASSVPAPVWEAAQIHPARPGAPLQLSPEQHLLLDLFGQAPR